MIPLRDKIPIRSKVPNRKNYICYRDELESDFNSRCGYCDDHLKEKKLFEIDHFAPLKYFDDLKNVYENLVYSCRFCNRSKNGYWFGGNEGDPKIPHGKKEGLVDPCCREYDKQLHRSKEGRIIPKTELGKFMIKRLNLQLLRHKHLWDSRQSQKELEKVNKLLAEFKESKLKNADYEISHLNNIKKHHENIIESENLAGSSVK